MIQLTEQAKKLLDGKNFACVATLMPDGSPQVSPVWIERDGDEVLINVTVTRQKYKNLKRDPRVAIAVYDLTNPYSKVLIRGKVADITSGGAEEHIDKLSTKYNGKKYPYHLPEDPRVTVRIVPTSVTH